MRTHIVTSPSGTAANEDATALGDGVAVMLDGAGVPQRFRAGCRHDVAWYSHTLADVLVRDLADPAVPMRAALATAIATVRDLHADTCDLERGGPSATVVAVRWDAERIEHLVLCDSSLLIEHPDGTITRITDERLDAVSDREGTPERTEAMRNAPGGFFVARHEPEAADEALVGSIARDQVASLRLASDGITRAVDLLGIADDAGLVAGTRDAAAAEALIARIRAEETRRRETGLPMPPKTHDDATVITITADDR